MVMLHKRHAVIKTAGPALRALAVHGPGRTPQFKPVRVRRIGLAFRRSHPSWVEPSSQTPIDVYSGDDGAHPNPA